MYFVLDVVPEMQEVKQDAAMTEIGSATPSEEKTVELGPLVYESKVVYLIIVFLSLLMYVLKISLTPILSI